MRPTGTVTFLFTDIEGSTQRLAEVGTERYGALLETHRTLLRDACSRHAGHDFGGAGDSMFVAFGSAQDALRAAFAAQCALADHGWPGEQPLRVRMGVHTCEATSVAGDYVGLGVHRASRICDAGHGGQILLSHATQAIFAESGEFALRDLGEHRLKSLPQPQRIFQLLHPRLGADFPPLRTAGKPPPNLPAQATPMVGRDRELHAIEALLRASGIHLVTLTGPGGTGKTRLALQAAADLADEFADGVHFVSLDAIVDPALVLPAIAHTLGVSAAAGQSLVAYLSGKSMLIVVDNFEQVVAAAPELGALIAQSPSVKLIATSREPLRISGERVYPVSPLATPDPQDLPALDALAACESVALFVERARAVQPDFTLTHENARAVAEVCQHLDGLPLAIELAAARIGLLSPAAMVARLPQRLKLLAGGARDVPARQQTIRNAVAWSHDLLDADERDAFVRLGVFPSFTIDAAEAIGAATFDEVASLVAKSLATRRGDRIAMLETIRSFAVEKLDATAFGATTRDRHAAHYAALVDDAVRERAANEKASLDTLQLEHDNIRAALDWLHDRDAARYVRVAGALGWFWHLHSHFAEGRARLAEAIALAPASDAARARALASAGELAAWAGDLAAARPAIDEAVSIWRTQGREREVAAARIELGWGCFYGGEDAAARACMEESLQIARSVNDRALIARARIGLLQVLVGQNELDIVEPMARDALADAERQGDLRSAHFAHHFLADCPLIRGDAATAAPRYRRALELAVALGDRSEIGFEIQGVAMAAAGMGLSGRALTLGGAVDAEFERLGVDYSGVRFWNELIQRYFAAARTALGDAAADTAWQTGRQTPFEAAIAAALGG